MKIRTGFVSNSSSSSFVICKCFLNDEQIAKFRELIKSEEDVYLDESTNYFSGTNEYSFEKIENLLEELKIPDNHYVVEEC